MEENKEQKKNEEIKEKTADNLPAVLCFGRYCQRERSVFCGVKLKTAGWETERDSLLTGWMKERDTAASW